MVIVSAKVSKRKVLTGVLIAAAVILLLVFLFCRSSSEPGTVEAPAQTGKAATNEERLAFLQSFGWATSDTPAETQEVRIPAEFNDVFTRYNQLQQSMGYDLAEYAGKAVKRYVYTVTNHPSGCADCRATLLVCKNRIIGGDVTCRGENGRMHSFAMPE